jgi:hypothetical protein
MTRFKSEVVQSLCARRESICDAIAEARDARLNIMKELPEGDKLKLTEIIKKYMTASEGRKLLALSERLKDLVRNSTLLSREFNQVVNFSINLLNGAISTIWSVSNGARSYNGAGNVKTTTTCEARSVISRQA